MPLGMPGEAIVYEDGYFIWLTILFEYLKGGYFVQEMPGGNVVPYAKLPFSRNLNVV